MIRIVTVAAAASLYTFSVNGGIINGTEIGDIIAGYAAPYFAVLWAAEDARSTKYWPAHHYGLFLWLFWFFLIPHYVLKTRGSKGIGLALGLSGILWAPAMAGLLGWWLYEDLPDFR